MPEIRVRHDVPCESYTLPRVHVGKTWTTVDDETASYALKVRLHPTSDTSPLVFEQRSEDDAPVVTVEATTDATEDVRVEDVKVEPPKESKATPGPSGKRGQRTAETAKDTKDDAGK